MTFQCNVSMLSGENEGDMFVLARQNVQGLMPKTLHCRRYLTLEMWNILGMSNTCLHKVVHLYLVVPLERPSIHEGVAFSLVLCPFLLDELLLGQILQIIICILSHIFCYNAMLLLC